MKKEGAEESCLIWGQPTEKKGEKGGNEKVKGDQLTIYPVVTQN